MDKTTVQLKQIEELLCYVLIILKRTSPSDPPSDPSDSSVAIEAPQADLEPLIATAPQPVTSLSKKWKNK